MARGPPSKPAAPQRLTMKTLTTLALLSTFTLLPSAAPERSEVITEKSARVDELIDAHLGKAGLTPPPVADDETFVRVPVIRFCAITNG